MANTENEDFDEAYLEVPPAQAGQRLDQFLPSALASQGFTLSRSQIQELIKDGHILLNNKKVKPRADIFSGDKIHLRLPGKKSSVLVGQPLDLSIIFEDEHIIVIDKAPGLVVHPGSGNETGTLVNGLLHHCHGKLSFLADEGRPGIVHRLDKDTSGCLIAAKSDLAYESLVNQFSNREAKKAYVAIAAGFPEQSSGRIENHIGRHPGNRQKMAVISPPSGKLAITEYIVSHTDPNGFWSWINCQILTGRTHQIRVHLKESLNCPILGDAIYAQPHRQKIQVTRLMLHARELILRHPVRNEEMRFEALLPLEFNSFRPAGESG
jgi:23S rRNA pseudouridine1911/1915/1917 synthase